MISVGNDRRMNVGDSLQLRALASDGAVEWRPMLGLNCWECREPVASPSATRVYTATVTDPSGCSAADSLEVLVDLTVPVYVPTAFSPNGDGANDRIGPGWRHTAGRLLTWRIYDRWGSLMYESSPGSDDPLIGWDGSYRGKPAKPGVYLHAGQLQTADGRVLKISGSFTLLR